MLETKKILKAVDDVSLQIYKERLLVWLESPDAVNPHLEEL